MSSLADMLVVVVDRGEIGVAENSCAPNDGDVINAIVWHFGSNASSVTDVLLLL